MRINFNTWFIDVASHTGGTSTYVQQVDYVLHTANDVITPSQISNHVSGYRANGVTRTNTMSSGGTCTGGGAISATSIIQAEAYNAQFGTQTEACSDTGGGLDVGYIANGDWLQFNNVDFGTSGLTQFQARAASGAPWGVSGLVEVRLDNVNSAPIGDFAIAETGGWQSWRMVPANMAITTGIHTVFIRFTSAQPSEYVNLNWFTFAP